MAGWRSSNETWLAFTGRSPEQELGEGWAAGVHAGDYARCVATYRAAIEQRAPFQQEYRLRRQDGQYRWMLDKGVPRFGVDGSFTGFIGSLIDIHERKQYEETLRNRARQQSELADLGRRALAEMDLPALMEEVSRVVTRTLEAEFCEVLQALPDGRALRLVAGQGWQPGRVGRELVGGAAASMAGFTLLADAPVVVDDLARETRFHPPALLLDHGVVSGVTAIIPGEAAVWGVLGVFSAQQRRFDADDANFLQNVANVLGDALVRTQAEAELRVARDQTLAILENVAEGVTVQAPSGQLVFANDTAARLLGFDSSAALLAAGAGEVVSRYEIFDEHGAPVPPERLPGRRALQGERDARMTVHFRLRASGEAHWAQDRAQPVFDNLGQVALAVSVFHDITELKRTEITQRLLAEAGALLARDLDTQALLQGLARLPVPALSDYTILYQLDPNFGVRATGAYHADPAQASALQALVQYTQANSDPNSPVRQALLRQEPVLVPEVDVAAAVESLGPAHAHLAGLMPHSLLLVPLVARQRLSGLVLLARTRTAQPFSAFDQALAQELARRAALALDNSDLYASSQRLNTELEERVQERTEELHVAVEQLQENNVELGTHAAAKILALLDAEGPAFGARRHIVPDWLGNRAPLGDGKVRALISGIGLETSRRAFLEHYFATARALALQSRHMIEHLNRHGYAIDRVCLSGGHLKNPLLVRLYRDALGAGSSPRTPASRCCSAPRWSRRPPPASTPTCSPRWKPWRPARPCTRADPAWAAGA